MFNGTLQANPQGKITATGGGQINLDGTTPNKGTYTPAPNENQAPIPDPLAGMAMPSYSSAHNKSNACMSGPGIYGDLGLPNGPCTLAPGLYVIYGSNHVSGNTAITALGVTLYFVCATGTTPRACNANESGGDLLMTGNATMHITAPTSGPTAGLAAVSDRNNTPSSAGAATEPMRTRARCMRRAAPSTTAATVRGSSTTRWSSSATWTSAEAGPPWC